MSDFICGANDAGHHLTGVNWGRDLPEPVVMDIRNAVVGDPSPDGKGMVDICRGIEVGHVFQLGTSYSEAMGCTYLDQQGKAQAMVMGCYGIGVTRLLGAAIEQGHDERGIIWPISMAPFEVVICPMGYDKSEAVKTACNQLHDDLLAAGIDVILDDRNERPGAMFADWELIGAPFRVVIGDRGLANAEVEFKGRTDAESQNIPIAEIKAKVIAAVQAAKNSIQ
jgi:prolyl-tRNA synthetase